MTTILRLETPLVASPRRRPVGRRSWIGAAVLLSLGLHAALIGLSVALVRHQRPVTLVPVDTPAIVQLVMSPPGGATPPAAPVQPKATRSPKAARPTAAAPAATKPAHTAAASKATPASHTPKAAAPVAPPQPKATPSPEAVQSTAAAPAATPPANTEAASKESPTRQTAKPIQAAAEPPQPTAATARQPTTASPPPAPAESPPGDSSLHFDFANIESDTNALVTGDLMVPASPDVKFHNRKPSYPADAALRGEQGAVVLLIHVSPEGLVSSVDLLRSSGFGELDRAAEKTVLSWHFLPAVRNGRAVPDTMPMRIVFALD